MKKKSFVLISILLTCLVCSLIGFFAMETTYATNVEVVDIHSNEIKDNYVVNSEVEFPSSVTVNYRDNTYTATNGVVVYPNGESYVLSKHLLDVKGEYEIKYFYLEQNLKIIASKTFEVLDKYYGFNVDDGSYIQTTNDDNVELYDACTEGIKINLKDGNTFFFSEPINLNKVDGAMQSIINITPIMGKHIVEPIEWDDSGKEINWANEYTPYAKKLFIRLTDCYNSNVYVDFIYSFSNQTGYFRAGSNTQADVGVMGRQKNDKESSIVKFFNLEGKPYSAWFGAYGALNVNMYNSRYRNGTSLYFDNDNNIAYFELLGDSKGQTIINDLMNSDYYGNTLFEGFTTGEVYLSMWAEEYVDSSLTVEIHSIGQYSAKELIAQKELDYRDTVKPEIVLDTVMTDEKGFYAAIGDIVTIPSVTSYDVNSVDSVKVNVYRNYGESNQVKVAVNQNKFKITSVDVYTIEYSQKDKFGNENFFTVKVLPKYVENSQSIYIQTLKLTSLQAGLAYTLPEYEIKTINRYEFVNCSIRAEHEKQIIEIDSELKTFVPEYSGEYKIIYYLNDNFSSSVYSYTINCQASNNVYFRELPILPKYFVKGHKYNLGEIFAYTYESGKPSKVYANLYASFDGNANVKVENSYAVDILGEQKVKFTYEYNGTAVYSQEVPIINVSDPSGKEIDLFKYFIGDVDYVDELENGKRPSDMVLKANAYGNAKIEFINAINYQNFTMKTKTISELSDFASIKYTLIGVQDSSQKVVFEVKKYGENTQFLIDGILTFSISKPLIDGKVKTLSYTKSNSQIIYDSYVSVYDLDFTGALVYLEIEFTGVTGDAGIAISEINKQKFSGQYTKDKISPQVIVNDYRGEYLVGTVVDIPVPIFTDVLSQIDYDKLYLTVKDQTGASVTAKDGTVLDLSGLEVLKLYQVDVEKISSYFITYVVQDSAGVKVIYQYSIVGIDMEGPSINISGKVKENINIKVGDTVNFDYTVMDNVTKVEEIKVFVKLYNENTATYSSVEGKKIVFNQKGVYTVKIIALDEASNMSVKSFTVVVK